MREKNVEERERERKREREKERKREREKERDSPIMELLLTEHVVHKVDVSRQKQHNKS